MPDSYAQMERICEMQKRCTGHAIGRVLRDETRKLVRDITAVVSKRSERKALLLQLCHLEDAIRSVLHVKDGSLDNDIDYEK
jgi:predicted HAD superfamily phosphohydrolase